MGFPRISVAEELDDEVDVPGHAKVPVKHDGDSTHDEILCSRALERFEEAEKITVHAA